MTTAAIVDKPKVLFVSEDGRRAEGLGGEVAAAFDIEAATPDEAALRRLIVEEPFAVVVRAAPGAAMAAVEFLVKASGSAPDTIRILLTDDCSPSVVQAAVNEAQVFRLQASSSTESLARLLQESQRHYRHSNMRKDVLETTLRRSLEVLSGVLSMANPSVFSRGSRVQEIVAHACRKLQVRNGWKVEMAALLSQLGCVALPSETIVRAYSGVSLSEMEQMAFDSHPTTAYELLRTIPRLESVAQLVLRQNRAASVDRFPSDPHSWNQMLLSGEILRIALVFEAAIAMSSVPVALQQLAEDRSCHPMILDALQDIDLSWDGKQTLAVRLDELDEGMVLQSDVLSHNGLLLAAKGTRVNGVLLLRLANCAGGVGVREPIAVLAE